MRRIGLAIAATLLATTPAMSESSVAWSCQNADFEIACTAAGCSATASHTPMRIRIDPAEISVCAYSGCWAGQPDMRVQLGGFVNVAGLALPFSTDEADRRDIAVSIDTADGTGTVLVSGFTASPVTCVQG